MALRGLTYQREFGVWSKRSDRFGGQPSWLETVIREYELGHQGPFHACGEYCDCISCCRMKWLQNPKCNCLLGKHWEYSLTLDDAMRQKWKKCRCEPEPRPPVEESVCRCLLLLPTQEWDPNEEASSQQTEIEYDIPYADSEGESPEVSLGDPSELAPWAREIIERMLRNGWKFPPRGYDPWTGTWSTAVQSPSPGNTVPFPGSPVGGDGVGPLDGVAQDLQPNDETADTASSSGLKRKLNASASTQCSPERQLGEEHCNSSPNQQRILSQY